MKKKKDNIDIDNLIEKLLQRAKDEKSGSKNKSRKKGAVPREDGVDSDSKKQK